MRSTLIKFNNWQVKKRQVKAPAENILVLCPRCIQYHQCGQPVTHDPSTCKQCGKCQVMDLVNLCTELGVKLKIATGGGVAVKLAKDPSVKVIVAVACPRELCLGVLFTLPKPVIAIENILENGPCVDTGVSIEKVRQALEELIETDQ